MAQSRKAFRAVEGHPLAVSLVVVACALAVLFLVPQDGIAGMALVRAGVAVVGIALAAWLFGARAFRLSAEGFGFAFRLALLVLVASLAFGILALLAASWAGSELHFAAGLLGAAAVLCLLVGIVEELTFRVFLQGGLLAHMGSDRSALFIALAVCALAFGFAHVLPYVLGGVSSVAAAAQIVLKTLSAAMFGFVLSVAYLATRNFWAVVAVHALNDFIAFAVEALTQGTLTAGSYVSTDAAGMAIVAYAVVILIYVPAFVGAVRTLGRLGPPQGGPFLEDYEPRSPYLASAAHMKAGR